MTDDPQHRDLLQHAPTVREDLAAADQLHGALETLFEKVPDDAVVATCLPACVKFRVLVRALLRELDKLARLAEGKPPAPDDDVNPSKARALLGEWQAARTPFHDDAHRHKGYLEKLALRIYR